MKSGVVKLLIVLAVHSSVAQQFELIEQSYGLEQVNGVSVADYDRDGDFDVFLVASRIFDPQDPATWNRLLQNDGNGIFTNVTEEAGLYAAPIDPKGGSQGSKMGASWGDYDGDGFPDLYLTNNGYNELWHNDQDGSFSNVTSELDVAGCYTCYSANALWWDYDLDGDLDLYVSNWIKENVLYRNDNGQFADISISSGVNDVGFTWTSVPFDFDRNGLPDLYVINDVGDNRLYLNKGDDRFEEATERFGLVDDGDGMGIGITDFDGDGFFDFFVTNIHDFEPNPFFINDGNDFYSDKASELRVDNTGWGWGARFLDIDHDLDEDLYVVNGMDSPYGDGDRNKLFIHQGAFFSDASGWSGMDLESMGIGLESFDMDLDGDLDLLVGHRNALPIIFKNRILEIPGNGKNWIQLTLEGTVSNSHGFGSVIRIQCSGKSYYRYHSGVNLLGQSIKSIHFGLGEHENIDRIEITWPNGYQETMDQVEVNQVIHIQEMTLHPSSVVTSLDQAIKIQVYPNPVDEALHLILPEQEMGSIIIRDLNGKLLYSEQLRNSEDAYRIDFSLLSTGTYTYQITHSKGVLNGTLFKR